MSRPRVGQTLMVLTTWGITLFASLCPRASGGQESADPLPTFQPIPMAVDQGRASFDIPGSGPGSRTLVIVSALATQGGPFPVRLLARPTDRPRSMKPGPRARSIETAPFLPRAVEPVRPAEGRPRERRTFHVLAPGGNLSRASSYLAIEAHLSAVGRGVEVYTDSADLGFVESKTLRDLVETFDSDVLPMIVARFGQATDVDHNGRFTVFMTSRLGRAARGVGLDGFVRGADLDRGVSAPFGNGCDMMYLNTSLVSGPHLRTVLAHEYTHAVGFSRKVLGDGGGFEEEGWLDEAICHLVEDDLGFSRSNIDYRVSAFLSRPERYRLVVEDYYAADLFRSHGNRGATYLFLRWCVDQFGPSLLERLMLSQTRGIRNLEAATGWAFEDLFRGWTIALAISGIDGGSWQAGSYRSIDPRGEFEDWILAGPRTSTVSTSSLADSWNAAPTTAHYCMVENDSAGAVRVEVIGPTGTALQVTVVPLPVGSGRPELKIRGANSNSKMVCVQVEVVERDGRPVRLGSLAWEPLVPPIAPREAATSRGALDMLGIAARFGTSALPGGGSLRSQEFALPRVERGDGPLVFKVVGLDSAGRRVAAWAEFIPPSASSRNSLRTGSD